jgi:hypothetical protein
MTTMLVIFFVLLFVVLIVALLRDSAMYHPFDYEDEVTTTTTTTTVVDTPATGSGPAHAGLNINGFPIVGMLQRQFEGSTPFVIDPVDNDKVFLNTSDDIYEDGAGKWWGLQ